MRSDISALRITEWEDEIPFDNVWIELNTNDSSKIFINTIYIPGWASFEHINSYFKQLFEIINMREPYSRFILLGNYNLPCIEWIRNGNHCIPLSSESRLAKELVNTMITTNLTQRNHIKNKFNRTLDLALSNMDLSIHRATEIMKEDDYHPSLHLEINKTNIKYMKNKKEPKYNFFNANYTAINAEISRIDWESELNLNDIDDCVDKFNNVLNAIISKYTPKISPKSNDYPK